MPRAGLPGADTTRRVGRRVRVLVVHAATGLSGAATSYLWLLLARVALGVLTATTGPAVASTPSFFPSAHC
jgi:hypothetical protein